MLTNENGIQRLADGAITNSAVGRRPSSSKPLLRHWIAMIGCVVATIGLALNPARLFALIAFGVSSFRPLLGCLLGSSPAGLAVLFTRICAEFFLFLSYTAPAC
jgi:hypothetical protein